MKNFVIICSLFLGNLLSCEKDSSSIGIEPGPPGSYSYFSYDSLGTPVVSGWLKYEKTDSITINGSWQLKKLVNRDDLGPQFGKGKLIGRIEDSSINIELNPRFNDYNLELVGTLSNSRIEGKWYWLSYSGVTNWGTFKASKN